MEIELGKFDDIARAAINWLTELQITEASKPVEFGGEIWQVTFKRKHKKGDLRP